MVKIKSKAHTSNRKLSLPKKNNATIPPRETLRKKHNIQSIVSDFVDIVSDFVPQIMPTVVVDSENHSASFEAIPETVTTPDYISPTPEPSVTFFQAIRAHKHFSIMAISLLCSFLVSATFYWAAKNLMKIKFDDMFEEKLPRYQNLVYGIGQVHNIDVDRIILQDDLDENYFTQANGQISLDIHRIWEENKSIQPIANQKATLPPMSTAEPVLANTMKSVTQYS